MAKRPIVEHGLCNHAEEERCPHYDAVDTLTAERDRLRERLQVSDNLVVNLRSQLTTAKEVLRELSEAWKENNKFRGDDAACEADKLLQGEVEKCGTCGGSGIDSEGYSPGHVEMLPCPDCQPSANKNTYFHSDPDTDGVEKRTQEED